MKRKYNYFYKITNNINNHFYYGVHCTDNLDDGYMGSGTRLKYAYKKYGIENFSKEILKFFDSITEAYKYESEVVTEDLVHDPDCYNIKCGGEGWNTYGTVIVKDKDGNNFRCDKNDPKYLSGEYISVSKNIVSVKDKNNNTYSVSIDDPRYLNGELIPVNSGKVIALNIKTNLYEFLDSSIYQQNKHLYKTSMTDKITVKDNKGNYFVVDKNDSRYLNGELRGTFFNRKHTEETKEKMRIFHQTKKPQLGEKNSQYGTCWIYKIDENNKPINIKIKKEKLDEYLNDGWIKGRKIKC
jgi:hypothetical protein